MDQGAAQAVRDIEETRERIGSNIHELEERMPPPAQLARKAAGIALGGGATGTAFWFAVRRMRRRNAKKKVTEQARIVLNVLPEDFIKKIGARMEDGQWRAWAGGFAGAWLLIRLAELRQLRGLKRTIAAR